MSAFVGLGSLATAQQASVTDAAPPTTTPVFSAPAPSNGSYLTLGMQRGTFNAQAATADGALLGVCATPNFTYVSGYGPTAGAGANPALTAKIYKFTHAGVLSGTFAQGINAASLWGDRDLATDDAAGNLYGGSENGWFNQYTLNGAGDITGVTTYSVPGVGVIRALGRDQTSSARIFFTANFTATIFSFDLDGGGPNVPVVTGSFGNPGRAFYGFACNPLDADKVWGFSQNGPGTSGTIDRVEWNELTRSGGWAMTGTSFFGTTTGGVNIAGGADTYVDNSLPSSPFMDFIGLHQSSPDVVRIYESNIRNGTPTTTFCTAKATLVCGQPSISAAGTSSVTASSGFTVSAGPARSDKSGILLYNNAGVVAGVPFQGGTLCVPAMGLRRAGSTNSQGTCGPANCTGVFSLDMNAFAQGAWVVPDCAGAPTATPPNNPAAFLLTPGIQIDVQYWGRDSVPTGSFVSNGLSYIQGP
jgi:hypothetical protein